MGDIIKLLPDHVANQIAAGEVVQRPSSVVKELLENAIDAGATSIKLLIKDSGKTLIQVIDNGKGMSETDARMSFERHATSKITKADDLFNLNTKGFRGEALASIAAVAHVVLKTRTAHSDTGTAIVIEGSKVSSQEVCATPPGTSIAVKNLFFNIPARRNFLKSNTVELRHIIDEFQRVALAHAHIAFALYHNDGELFNLPESNRKQRIVGVFGGKTQEKLVPVTEETDLVKISGYVVKPEFAKRTRGEQFFFVNDRFIKSAYLNHAVSAAFDGLLAERARASYFIFLDVDPKSIDINIHPTKTEIKFDDEHALYAILRSTVKHSLGQFNIAPILDFERDATMDTPYNYKDKGISPPKVEVDRNFNPFENVQPNTGGTRTQNFEKQDTEGWEQLYEGLDTQKDKTAAFQHTFESDAVTAPLFGNSQQTEDRAIQTYQLHRRYIVSTIKSGMVVIDQHRAHQRITYEELLHTMTIKESSSQQLLFSLVFTYTANELAIFKELRETLESTGFVFGKIEKETVEITGIPITLSESEVPIVLEQVLSDLEHQIPDSGFSQVDILAKSMAKSTAVRVGEQLTIEEQEHLVHRLFACKEPTLSPFNKVTYITVTLDELERQFK